MKALLIGVLLWWSAGLKTNVFAADFVFPCNVEIKRPLPIDSGNFHVLAYVENLPLAANSSSKFTWMKLTAPSTGSWIRLFDSTQEFSYRIVTLKFPVSTESTGVSYRLGFCYLGPESTDKSPPKDQSRGLYYLDGTVGVGTATDYISYSGSVSGICDLRNGNTKLARNAIELYPQSIDPDISFSVNLGALTPSGVYFSTGLNSSTTNVPRYCKINVEVTESAIQPRPYLVDLNQARIDLQIFK